MKPLEALADPTRRQLFERLREGPCSVNELANLVPVSQPAVSQHLRVLKEARLVHVQRNGKQRIYSLNPEGLVELRAYVEGLWEDVLGAFQEAAKKYSKEEVSMNNVRSTQEVIAPVEKSIAIPLPVEAAFRLFTEGVAQWWPLETHSVGGEKAASCHIEGRIGGRFYEVLQDGSQSEWGRVLAWEPPYRFKCSFYPGYTPEYATELEVIFQEEGGGTRLSLIHRGWERRATFTGERAQVERDNYDSGWDFVLGKYVACASLE